MKIAVVTGSRAEYGLLEPLMRKIQATSSLELQLIVTGAHLLPEFGSTGEDIRRAGFTIDSFISEVGKATNGAEVSRQVGAGIVAFTDALETLTPQAVLLVGDRFELLAAAVASFFLDIPIVHVHGGEVTNGAFDDAVRHVISRFARVHAVAAPEYAERLIRAGENPSSVHVVGGLGVDSVWNAEKLTIPELEAELGIPLGNPLLLVTYHPVTAASHDTSAEIQALILALASFPDATVVFTAPNADPEHQEISQAVEAATKRNEKWHLFTSLGTGRYLSLLSHSSAVIGNSSSGLLEAPSLGIPTVNIGPRQDGRLKAASVLSCGSSRSEIEATISRALSSEFADSLLGTLSPYGEAGASDRILALLEATDFDTLGNKQYYDKPEGL